MSKVTGQERAVYFWLLVGNEVKNVLGVRGPDPDVGSAIYHLCDL